MPFTRRDFLTRVGQVGGYSAAFTAMQGLGMLPAKAERVLPMAAAADVGKGKTVVMLGSGVAGMVSALELRDLGFRVVVLEARSRPGGRNWTVRGGDKIKLLDGTEQTCEFSPGLYQNAGPARLPSIHTTMLGYCRRFGVQLEVEVNLSRGDRLQNDAANGGKAVAQRQADNDTRGRVSELLMKCVNQGALDAELTGQDKERMLDFLRYYGPLDKDGAYAGSDRAGYTEYMGAGDQAGTKLKPLGLHTLLEAQFWSGMMFGEEYDQQATMFQPVGGMDHIAYAFAKELGEVIRYESPVTEIRRQGEGVRIGYTEKGQARSITADYCICALPLTQVRKTANDFSPAYTNVIATCSYAGAYKIAWESRRFWEMDDNIYGGLEWVAKGPSPVWLPSAGFFTQRGVLVSGYAYDSSGVFDALTLKEKLDMSRASVEKLHPGHGVELEKPIYVPWARVPWNEGSWIGEYGTQPAGTADGVNANYETLLAADGPFYFAGDHVSHIVGWQEGAALSAKRAVGMIVERVRG